MDYSAFYAGTCFDAHRFLGAHLTGSGAVFRTFAPAADRISLIGDFSGWAEIPMQREHDGNFWSCAAQAHAGQMYKYRIYDRSGHPVDHCDPYGVSMELRPACASILRDLTDYAFDDGEWMAARTDGRDKPLNIYEMHFGSWRRDPKRENGWYSYAELAQQLLPYLRENGYNYVELMPLGEHPCDESWGYQSTCFFAPTSRYGTPRELMQFVDACHQSGVGVLLDFIPVHFAVDDYALARYDGTPLYEYPNRDVGQSEWGSCNFMHSRGEVRSFLQSAAHYWLETYHFDGLRMDAISNMIYWQGRRERGENRDAIAFLRSMNQGLRARHPGVILAAEDSTNYPGVTKPAEAGGLGFDYKWDMGWMNDTLDYFRTPPEERSAAYHRLTFSMMYYYDERYLLPLSHDESVHGKATVVQKMYGAYEQKFPQARALYLYMYAHPGKKLNFMGGEIGQLREWDEKRQQDWELLRYPIHDAFRAFMRDLNRLYLRSPALWAQDYSRDGFRWIDCHEEEACVYSFRRTGGGQTLLALFNFSDRPRLCALPAEDRDVSLLLSTESEAYGGTEKPGFSPVPGPDGSLCAALPPFSGKLLAAQTR